MLLSIFEFEKYACPSLDLSAVSITGNQIPVSLKLYEVYFDVNFLDYEEVEKLLESNGLENTTNSDVKRLAKNFVLERHSKRVSNKATFNEKDQIIRNLTERNQQLANEKGIIEGEKVSLNFSLRPILWKAV